jgi:hypothetical protein
MRTAHFADRNEPRVLILQVAEVAGSAADKIHRPDSHVRFHETQLFLHKCGIVLRHFALNNPHGGLLRARIAL